MSILNPANRIIEQKHKLELKYYYINALLFLAEERLRTSKRFRNFVMESQHSNVVYMQVPHLFCKIPQIPTLQPTHTLNFLMI
jgi:hypothetical protein